jgi:hypothetical protein
MAKIYILFTFFLLAAIYSCGSRTPFMPENKILKEVYNIEYNSQDFSIYLKSFNKDTINLLVDAYVDKYKDKKLAMLKFKLYDKEMPLELVNKIDEPMKTDSNGIAQMTFPTSGTKWAQCWYWYKTGDRDLSDIKTVK